MNADNLLEFKYDNKEETVQFTIDLTKGDTKFLRNVRDRIIDILEKRVLEEALRDEK